jgi:hypothetical protein
MVDPCDVHIAEQREAPPPAATVIERASFAVGAHPRGPIITVLVDGLVAFNLRADPPVAWALSRALHEASRAQCALEQRMLQREQRR